MATKLRPLYYRVLVRRKATKTDVQVNGVYIPDSAVEKPEEGEVIAVGNGRIEKGERMPSRLFCRCDCRIRPLQRQ